MTLFLLEGAMADGIGCVYGIRSGVTGVCDVEIEVVKSYMSSTNSDVTASMCLARPNFCEIYCTDSMWDIAASW